MVFRPCLGSGGKIEPSLLYSTMMILFSLKSNGRKRALFLDHRKTRNTRTQRSFDNLSHRVLGLNSSLEGNRMNSRKTRE